MPGFWHFNALLKRVSLIGFGTFLWANIYAEEKPLVYSFSIEEFVKRAQQYSLRSQTVESSFRSSEWGWKAARRDLSWPRLDANLKQSRSEADDDAGLQTLTRKHEEGFTLTQPFLTGTRLSLGGTWSHTRSTLETVGLSSSTSSSDRTKPQWTATLKQPLFIFTGNSSLRSRKQANLQWGNDQDNFRNDQLQIEFDARTRYYNLVLQQETTDVERKKLESATLVHEVTRALVRAGKLAEVEAVRADIRAKKDIRRVQNSENNLEKSMNEAKDELYLPSEAKLKLSSKLTYEPFHFALNDLMQIGLENNPGLLVARRQVDLAELALKNTREGDRPQLNATGTYQLSRNRDDNTTPLDPHSWSVELGMDWPLFDGTQTQLKTKQSKVSLDNARRSLENQTRQFRVDIENAFLELKRTEEQIADFEPQRLSAQRNVNAIRLQYRNGLTRLTDVFDAENELRDLELEYLGLLVNFNTTRDRLNYLTGVSLRDWEKKK